MDRVTLTLPREREFAGVADLVVGGLAARLDLTLEYLDDLQLALEGLLEREEGEGEVTVTLAVGDGQLEAHVGPLSEAVARDLDEARGADLGLRRLLDTVVDDIAVAERDGAAWVELRKRFTTTGGVGGSA